MALKFQQIPVWPFQANCTIIFDDSSKTALVVDPGGSSNVILAFLEKNNLHLDSVWLTHAHYDHLSGLKDFPQQSEIPLFLKEEDMVLFEQVNEQAELFGLPSISITWKPTAAPNFYSSKDNSINFEILPTPGHTPGSLSLYFPEPNWVVVGDTLFAHGGIGRTDLPGGSMLALRHSLKDVLFNLRNDCLVLTGHGENTTIGQEKGFHH